MGFGGAGGKREPHCQAAGSLLDGKPNLLLYGQEKNLGTSEHATWAESRSRTTDAGNTTTNHEVENGENVNDLE
jgi:hypothetical protein